MSIEITISAWKQLTDLYAVSKNHSLSITDFTESLENDVYVYTLNEGALTLTDKEYFIFWATGYCSIRFGIEPEPEEPLHFTLTPKPIYEVNVSSEELDKQCFTGNTVIETVDCQNLAWKDNEMTSAFSGCSNLTTVTNISNLVTNISSGFSDCPKLQSVIFQSNNISNALDAFTCSTTILEDTRHVYCHFDSAVNILSNTLRSFARAGYDSTKRKDNVVIHNLDYDSTQPKITVLSDRDAATIQCYKSESMYGWASTPATEGDPVDVVYTLTDNPIQGSTVYDSTKELIGNVTDIVTEPAGIIVDGVVYSRNTTSDFDYDTVLVPIANIGFYRARLPELPIRVKVVISYLNKHTQQILNLTEDSMVYQETEKIIGFFNTAGDYTYTLLPESYQIVVRGAGGAGGGTGGAGYSGTNGGTGGAGAKGEIIAFPLFVEENTELTFHVGAKGLTKANGGNGGSGGDGGGGFAIGGHGGDGGGGGEPTYLAFNDNFYIANGGGGGGAGGGGGTSGGINAARGGTGGGGGGYYKISLTAMREVNLGFNQDEEQNWYIEEYQETTGLTIPLDMTLSVGYTWTQQVESTSYTFVVQEVRNDGSIVISGSDTNSITYINSVIKNVWSIPASVNIVSVPGQKGGAQTTAQGAAGVAGNTTDFPSLSSGNGGTGYSNGGAGWINIAGGSGKTGGGASGASGGGWASYSDGGAGGGGGGAGAGGSTDAGGGGASYRGGGAASNHHTTPTDTLEENLTYGLNNNAGIGGTTNSDGTDGYVLIRLV